MQLREVREEASDMRKARDESDRALAEARAQVAELTGRLAEAAATAAEAERQLAALRAEAAGGDGIDVVEGARLRDAEAKLREAEVRPMCSGL